MNQELIENVARVLQRQHGKEMLGEVQKWEKRTPQERSSWRLIARTIIKVIEESQGAVPSGAEIASRAAAPTRARANRSI